MVAVFRDSVKALIPGSVRPGFINLNHHYFRSHNIYCLARMCSIFNYTSELDHQMRILFKLAFINVSPSTIFCLEKSRRSHGSVHFTVLLFSYDKLGHVSLRYCF